MRHTGHNLRKQAYYVEGPVPSRKALEVIREFHYSHSGSTAAVRSFGLYRVSDRRLLGVALFMAQRKSAAQSMWSGDHKRVLCLSRLAIDPRVPRNGASFLLGRAIRRLRDEGCWDCLTTYADTFEDHTGAIYKASNWEYMGLSTPRPRWQNAEGKIASRKQGRRWRSPEEMKRLGYSFVGSAPKHKYRFVLHAR